MLDDEPHLMEISLRDFVDQLVVDLQSSAAEASSSSSRG
jgi:hypothetical protein